VSIPNIEELMRQAQTFTQQLAKLKEELARQRVKGTAGGGMVAVEADGRGRILSVEIEPSVVESKDREMLQDLITAAVNQALQASKELAANAARSLTGGLPIPGIEGLLG